LKKISNICWYARGSHLNLFSKLSLRLNQDLKIIESYFVCHTRKEERILREEYNFDASVLGDFFNKKKSNHSINEEKLIELQKKYDSIPLRRLLWSETYEKCYSEEQLIFHLCSHFEFWEEFLEKNNIDHVVSESPSIMSTCVLWVVCKKLCIHFISITNWGINGRLMFTSSWRTGLDPFEEKLNKLTVDKTANSYKKSIEYLRNMEEKIEHPSYVNRDLYTGKKFKLNRNPIRFPQIGISDIIRFHQKVKEVKDRYYMNSTDRLNSYYLWAQSLLKIIFFKLRSPFESHLNLASERYFLFPLHTLHEWVYYSLMGPKYPNILYEIEKCAACLPIGCKLYVKEHPSNFGEKSISFYRLLKKIRNVRLIAHNEENLSIIRHSEGVITLGSSMGWEAFLLGKVVIVLTDIWYKDLPGVYRSKSSEHLAQLLQESLDLPVASEGEKLKVLYMLFESSFKGVVYPIIQLMSKENIENFVEPFKKLLKIKNGVDNTVT